MSEARPPASREILCPNCAAACLERACKVRCPRCGYFEDCTDGMLPVVRDAQPTGPDSRSSRSDPGKNGVLDTPRGV